MLHFIAVLEYNYSRAKAEIEQLFWRDFCDNYLEIVKARSYADPEKLKIFIADITEAEIEKNQQSALLTLAHTHNSYHTMC